ncbi:MAG: adenylosuccinate synthase, partial [Thermoleophilaceae bacterium]
VVVGDQKYALHLLPSGILSPGCTPVIGNGVVVDPSVLFSELNGLNERGVDTSKLLISGNAHIITPYNVTVDKVTERFLGKRKIGTTGRGIGPTYADKINRVGIRIQDLYDESILTQKVEAALDGKNQLLTKVFNRRAIEVGQVVEELLGYADRLKPYVADTVLVLNQALEQDKVVLFEGGQGTLLDIDHGTYPFVTSSNPVAGSATIGAGVGPKDIDEVWGVAKAYATRVGSGPFASELDDELGDRLREAGGEYGTTTGRPRRCGWIDLVALRYAVRVNSLTALCITKLDVLTGIQPLQVATRYRGPEGATFDQFPYHQSILHRATASYEQLPGWDEDIRGARKLEDLPEAARSYLRFIEDFVGVPIVLVGVGPARDQVIRIEQPAPSAGVGNGARRERTEQQLV